jgi:beta-glucosidase
VDVDAAEKIVGSAAFQARANLAMRKSIVLLRNETGALPVKPKTKVYFESYYSQNNSSPIHVQQPADDKYGVQFVKTPEEADMILLWITPAAKALFQSEGAPLYVSLSKNSVDIEHINTLTAKKANYTGGEFYKPLGNRRSV